MVELLQNLFVLCHSLPPRAPLPSLLLLLQHVEQVTHPHQYDERVGIRFEVETDEGFTFLVISVIGVKNGKGVLERGSITLDKKCQMYKKREGKYCIPGLDVVCEIMRASR